MEVKTSGMCVNENELYVRVKIKVTHAKLRGSLHTTIFSKYTELLQLKKIFRIFWNYFWNFFEIKVYVKSAVVFFLNGGHR